MVQTTHDSGKENRDAGKTRIPEKPQEQSIRQADSQDYAASLSHFLQQQSGGEMFSALPDSCLLELSAKFGNSWLIERIFGGGNDIGLYELPENDSCDESEDIPVNSVETRWPLLYAYEETQTDGGGSSGLNVRSNAFPAAAFRVLGAAAQQ